MSLGTVAGLFVGAFIAQAQTSTNQQWGTNTLGSMKSSAESALADARSERMAQDPKLFLQNAYQDNLTEVQVGQMAQQKGQSQKVKDYGQSLVRDHQAVNEKVQQIAKQKGVELTNKLDMRHQMKVDRLTALTGEEFDKTFMEEQIKAHQETVALFEKVASKSTDNEVKEFAQSTLPELRHHLEMAQGSGTINEASGAQGTNNMGDTNKHNMQQPQEPEKPGSTQSPN